MMSINHISIVYYYLVHYRSRVVVKQQQNIKSLFTYNIYIQYTISAEHALSRETSRLRVTSSVSTTEMLSTHDVTLRNVDWSLFHIKIRFVVGHQDQNGQN